MSQRIDDMLNILNSTRNILQRLWIKRVDIDFIETERLGQDERCREACGQKRREGRDEHDGGRTARGWGDASGRVEAYICPQPSGCGYCTVIGATQSGATARTEDGNE